MTSGPFEKRLPRTCAAPGVGRDLVGEWLGAALDGDDLHRAKLLVSELITNAIRHGDGDIVLRAKVDEEHVLVEVIDEGEGFEYEARRTGFESLQGRGLAVVDAEASRWGIHEGTTHVWFELERPGPRLGTEAKPDI